MVDRNFESFGEPTPQPTEQHLNYLEIAESSGKPAKPPYPAWTQAECNGPPAQTAAGNDMESLALSQLGKRIDDGYGADGCVAAVANHVLRPHLDRIGQGNTFPPKGIADTGTLLRWAKAHGDLAEVKTVPQKELKASDLQPGDIIIGRKSDGDHCMIASRFPASWNLSSNDIALLGNTGHPDWVPDGPNYPHFRMQEIIGYKADEKTINYDHGGPEGSSPANPYNLPGAQWIIIRMKK
ncbi:MAG TPA: hypothetical protein V6C81_26665 [Planktothrix sp.]|jgi:hypothetical protein